MFQISRMNFFNDEAVLILVLITVQLSSQKSTVYSPNYVAAVVEYAPIVPTQISQPSDILVPNLENYKRFIVEAAAKDVDIIVFPSYDLNSFGIPKKVFNSPEFLSDVSHPEEQVIPCINSTNGSSVVQQLSCAARHHKLYVVAVVFEFVTCNPEITPSCRNAKYATTVAFDREGKIVGKYRDSNLHGEPYIQKPYPAEISKFDTDFGVTFGIISGLGILDHQPGFNLMHELLVADFVYPHFWYNELPFLTGIQIQACWSRGHNVNLLAAAHNNPSRSHGGSAIHCGKSGTRAAFVGSNSSKLVIAMVDKKIRSRTDGRDSCSAEVPDCELPLKSFPTYKHSLLRKEFLKRYATIELARYFEYVSNIATVERNFTLCEDGFCCEFEIKMFTEIVPPETTHSDTRSNGYYYRLAAFQGVRTISGVFTTGIQVCAVIACSGTQLTSCGQQVDSKRQLTMRTTFEKLRINASYRYEDTSQSPNTLTETFGVLPVNSFKFIRLENPAKNIVEVSMYSTVPNISFYTFGIYGRDYDKDGSPLPV